MAAKGQEAKNKIIEKIAEAFGKDYIGESNKKYYVWSSENGEPIQICIALTCPKSPIETDNVRGALDFSDSASSTTSKNVISAEITQEERDNLEALMNKLGL